MNLLATAVARTMEALCILTEGLPIGTNLGLLHFFWMQISGTLLSSRGALFPALQAGGLAPAATRRAWAAFRYGAWQIDELLTTWEDYVVAQGQWQEHQHAGYRAKAVDLTAYWRPTVQGLTTKHYHPQAGKALPAVVLGIIARVGHVHGQRVAVVTDLVRAAPDEPTESSLQTRVIQQVAQTLAANEVSVFDAGFKIRALQAAHLDRYLVRLAVNFTARRNVLPAYKGKGRRPRYGTLVRPLARTGRTGQTIPATTPDRVETWTEQGVQFRAEFWDNLVLPDVPVQAANPTFTVVAIYDPRFRPPWLLACPLPLSGAALRGLYRDRWPVEQVPLAGKQMLGGARQFVFAPESCQRLPELNLLSGAIVTYLAATLPAVPTGFWDRHPQPTPGRLRRLLARTSFPESYPLPERLRKKATVWAHLPLGIRGHRRTKQPASS